MTSNKVGRWIIELQHCVGVNVGHIRGPSIYLADVCGRNPAGFTENELRELRQPASLTVRAVNLDVDPGVTHALKDLAAYQAADQRLARITERLNKYPTQVDPKYKVTQKTGTFEKPNKNLKKSKKNNLTEIEPLQLAF